MTATSPVSRQLFDPTTRSLRAPRMLARSADCCSPASLPELPPGAVPADDDFGQEPVPFDEDAQPDWADLIALLNERDRDADASGSADSLTDDG